MPEPTHGDVGATTPPEVSLDALADALAARLADRLSVPGRFLGVAAAAAYADVSADSIRAMLAGGKLTALRPVPGRVVIDKRELDSVILASTGRPARRRGKYRR